VVTMDRNRAERSDALRKQHRRAIARTKPPCGICGGEIDYALKYPDPMSFVVDHIVPFSKGGVDTIDNKQASHSTCNRAKWDRIEGGPPRVIETWVTSRTW
jgi:5-methylcytosine-specific restriction endonuclease McrA